MIDNIGRNGAGRIDLKRPQAEGGTPVAPAAPIGSARGNAGVGQAVSDIARAGAPIDMDKVAAIRAAIAEGRYPVDPDKIAERMIALDLSPLA